MIKLHPRLAEFIHSKVLLKNDIPEDRKEILRKLVNFVASRVADGKPSLANLGSGGRGLLRHSQCRYLFRRHRGNCVQSTCSGGIGTRWIYHRKAKPQRESDISDQLLAGKGGAALFLKTI